MGFLDYFRKNEAVRIVKNTDDTDGLPYNKKLTKSFLDEINALNANELNSFRLLSSNKNERFNAYDLMAQDSRVASILDSYADDCTQFNQSSNVIWVESNDSDIAKFGNKIIDDLQINKHAWEHVRNLCKYGDLFLELFYDLENEIKQEEYNTKIYNIPKGAKLENRIEMIKNPACIYDLVQKGKTKFFIKTSNDDKLGTEKILNNNGIYNVSDLSSTVMPPDKFVHISINNSNTRYPNKFVVTNIDNQTEETYDVKEGNSVLANNYKTWSELNLLEDSVLLNRLSKSAIVRMIQVEVGNMDDDEVDDVLKTLRDKISRNRYFDNSTGVYKNQINPGPLENIIYHATHEGKGTITHSTMGGDVDVKALADIDHFLEKFAQGFNVPVAYVKEKNSDGGGLSAGTSLTKFDAKYGRTLKRYQNAYINGITDLINIYAYKRGCEKYINNFTVKMVSPSAVEENERDEKLKNHTEMIRDIMTVINEQDDLYEQSTKKKILNYLIRNLLEDVDLNEILEQDELESSNNSSDSSNVDSDNNIDETESENNELNIEGN